MAPAGGPAQKILDGVNEGLRLLEMRRMARGGNLADLRRGGGAREVVRQRDELPIECARDEQHRHSDARKTSNSGGCAPGPRPRRLAASPRALLPRRWRAAPP